ncbi:MAG: protein-L-isoaspartate(D-aspartate) O-methyltransferase [Bacteroidetes bacterium]|nr:protein-L-isoaspartate(D-aspartate) O-methyltransferase [Bacteroidota bacterium]
MNKLLLSLLLLLLFPLLSCSQSSSFKTLRNRMVKTQIEYRGIKDRAVLGAMRKVERHRFVPKYLRNNAYDDRPLPIGNGQTISQPYIVAFMTNAIQLNPDFRVLEIGTGSGYQAAVLGEIVKEVYTVEIVEELGMQARQLLEQQGYKNIHVRIGDGYKGWKAHAPYDAIVVTAAPEKVPPLLLEQLKEGGRMIIPVGPIHNVQQLKLIEKKGDKTITENLLPVRFVPFTRNR